jgi:hypothetical protein
MVWYLKMCLLVGTDDGVVPEDLYPCRNKKLVWYEPGLVPEDLSACMYRNWCDT